MFPALSQVGHKLKDGRGVRTVVTQRLIRQGTDFYQEGTAKLVPRHEKYPHLRRDICGKIVG